MKKAKKLLALGAAAAVGALLYKRYQDSYEQIPEEESDFVVVEESDGDFEYMVTEEETELEA